MSTNSLVMYKSSLIQYYFSFKITLTARKRFFRIVYKNIFNNNIYPVQCARATREGYRETGTDYVDTRMKFNTNR